MCVLSRQSSLSAMHIAEKKLYGSIHKFNFSHGIFFPFCNMGKKSHGIFRFFKIAYFWKNIMKKIQWTYIFTRIVRLYLYFNIYIFPWEIFPMGFFSHFAIWEKIPMGFFDFFKIAYFWKNMNGINSMDI